MSIILYYSSGISGSPFIVNCKADVQNSFELRQFQFNEEKLKLKKKDIFKPERVFVFERNDELIDCSQFDTGVKESYYLTKTAGDLPIQWLHSGTQVKNATQPKCIISGNKIKCN